MNKLLFFTVTLAIGVGLFSYIIKDTGVNNILEVIFNIDPWQFAVLILLSAIGILISSFRWKIILNANGSFAPFRKILAARMVGFSINYLTPSGLIMGEPFKAVVLSSESDVKMGSAMVSIVVEGAIFLSTLLFFVTLGIISFITYSPVSNTIFGIIAIAFGFMAAVFYLFYSKMIRQNPEGQSEKGFFTYLIELLWLDKIAFVNQFKNRIGRREGEVKSFFSQHKNTILAAVLLSVAEIAVAFYGYWLTISFLGFSLSIKTLLGVSALMSISNLLPLPGSLGGLELSQIFAFNFFNLGGQVTAMGFSIITRIISLIFVAIGILYLAYFEAKTAMQKISLKWPAWKQKINEILGRFYKLF